MNAKTNSQMKFLLALTLLLASGPIAGGEKVKAGRPDTLLAYNTLNLIDATDDLSASYAYPVPFLPTLGDNAITFSNLPAEAAVEIRTLTGELVREVTDRDDANRLTWDGRNGRGEMVASDVYVYRIQNGRAFKIGKLVVVK